MRAEVSPEQSVAYAYSLDGGRHFQPFGPAIPLAGFSWWKGSRPALFTFVRPEPGRPYVPGSIDVDWFRVEHPQDYSFRYLTE